MAINNIISRSFTGVNLVMVSVVEETEPKDFQNRYFMFIKAVPSFQSDTGKSYNHKSAVTFKVEVEKAFALAFALEQFALGRGKIYDEQFGVFTIFADGSKSQFGSNSKKSMNLNYYHNQKTSKTNITLFTASDDNKIPFFMTPYEAHAMSQVLKFLGNECLRLEVTGQCVVVNKQYKSKQPQQQIPQMQQMQVPVQQQQNTTGLPLFNKDINKVAQDFTSAFTDVDLPF